MWSLCEESHGEFSVRHKMWKLGSWQMGKNKGSYRFACPKCEGIMEGTMDSIEKLCDEVETVNGFCYLEDRLSFSGGCEAAVTARVRIG